jgi:hypothetical protein
MWDCAESGSPRNNRHPPLIVRFRGEVTGHEFPKLQAPRYIRVVTLVVEPAGGKQESRLTVGPPVVLLPEENYRWFALLWRKERAEIGIRGDDDAALVFCALENLVVYRGLQRVIAHMNGVMAALSQSLCEDRR